MLDRFRAGRETADSRVELLAEVVVGGGERHRGPEPIRCMLQPALSANSKRDEHDGHDATEEDAVEGAGAADRCHADAEGAQAAQVELAGSSRPPTPAEPQPRYLSHPVFDGHFDLALRAACRRRRSRFLVCASSSTAFRTLLDRKSTRLNSS